MRNTLMSSLLLLSSFSAFACSNESGDDVENVGGQSGETKRTLTEAQGRIADLKKQIATLEELLKNSNEKLARAEERAETNNDQHVEALKKTQAQQEQLTELEAELAAVETQLEAHQKQVSELEAQRSALLDDKEELKNDKAELQRINAELKALFDSEEREFLDKIGELEDEVTQLQLLLREGGFPVVLHFAHTVEGAALELGKNYTLKSGGQLNVKEVRYWVSNVALTGDEDYVVPGAYYLLEDAPIQAGIQDQFTRPATKRETVTLLGVPGASYSGLSFSVGVDAKYNNNLSLQSGELHTLSNMASSSWMWFTSYIFSKFAGSYTAPAASSATAFKWETGSNATYRTIELEFDSPVDTSQTGALQIQLNVALENWLGAFSSTQPFPTSIGASNAPQMNGLADAEKGSFSLVSVED